MKEASKILISEDNLDIQYFLEMALCNYRTILSRNPDTAIHIIEDDPEIGCLISDFNFKGFSKTGLDIYKAYRKTHPEKPFVLFSSQTFFIEHNFKSPSDFFVQKPIELEQIVNLINSFHLKQIK